MGQLNFDKLYKEVEFEEYFADDNEAKKEPEKDNVAFNIENGGMKTLDYLDNVSRIAKASLAANRVLRLYPQYSNTAKASFSPASNPLKNCCEETFVEAENHDEQYHNSWDNIFLANKNDDNSNKTRNPINFFENSCNDNMFLKFAKAC